MQKSAESLEKTIEDNPHKLCIFTKIYSMRDMSEGFYEKRENNGNISHDWYPL